MLSLANIDIVETLSWFRAKGFKVSFLVPTETSLVKSIMDATQDFREFLSSQNLHIYEDQQQGTENKRLIETILISENQIYETPSDLILPHPRMHERAFVLIPLLDIAPNWIHPVLMKNTSQLCDNLDNEDISALTCI